MADRILIVEDELVLRETLTYNLVKEGYAVSAAADGRRALELVQEDAPDLVLLDIMLPGLDGFEVCRAIRREHTVPIIMLTARDDVVDKVVGLEIGADDYLTKPFSMRELLARVKAQLRRVRLLRDQYARTEVSQPGNLLVFGGLTIDLDRHEVVLNGEIVTLKPKEYEAPGVSCPEARARSVARSDPGGRVGVGLCRGKSHRRRPHSLAA